MHSTRALFYTLFLLSLFGVATASAQSQKWHWIDEDLEQLKIESSISGIFSNDLHFVRSSLKSYKIKVLRADEFGKNRLTALSFLERSNSFFAINANFFDTENQALGLVISSGRLLRNLHRGGNVLTGIFAITQNGPIILNRSKFQSEGILEAIQAGPRLIENSKPISGLNDSSTLSRRAGVCVDHKKRVIFYCSNSAIGGVSLENLQNILIQIGCVDALNLDGGGSAQMALDLSKIKNSNKTNSLIIDGRDPVPVVISLQTKLD